jgi:hypothetical protein
MTWAIVNLILIFNYIPAGSFQIPHMILEVGETCVPCYIWEFPDSPYDFRSAGNPCALLNLGVSRFPI